METKYSTYANPLIDRYCSKDMSYIFSPQFKFSTWRKLWVALAESEDTGDNRFHRLDIFKSVDTPIPLCLLN